MYYVSNIMLKGQAFTRARANGSWKVKISYDPRDLTYIYVHGDNLDDYQKCFITDSSSRYRDKTLEEVQYLLAAERIQKTKNQDTEAQAKTQLIAEIEDIVRQAEQDYKSETSRIDSDRQRVKNIRENRKVEKAVRREEEAFKLGDEDKETRGNTLNKESIGEEMNTIWICLLESRGRNCVMEKILIPNGSIAVEANYKEQIIPDYKGNPLIEALPELLAPDEVIEKLAFYPTYHKDERLLDRHYRIHMIDRLFQVFQPLPMNMELENKIARALRQGYLYRNPLGVELTKGFRQDYYGGNKKTPNIDGGFYASSLGFTLIGISGLGKTSSLQRILNLYPQIIVHSQYKDIPFSTYQLVWLKLECPHDGSIKGLLYEFFAEIDRLLGTNYYSKMLKTRATTDAMLTAMNQVIRNSSLGLLVIDEIQHLSMARSGGSEKMLNFFVNLVNNVGVPVILVGTPKAVRVLQGDFRQARRGVGPSGDMICDRIHKDGVWDLLANSIWHYQWTRKETPLTSELNNALYEETQGIPDLLKKVYGIAQAHAISTGKEEITPFIIKKVARENLKLVQPMITALKTGNIRELAKFEDISMIYVDFNSLLTRTKKSINLDLKAKEIRKRQNQQKKEDIMDKKKEAVLKLIDLGFDAKRAQKAVDKMNFDKQNRKVSVNEIVLDTIAVLTVKDKKTRETGKRVKGRGSRDRNQDYETSDIRYIVEKGKENNKNAYELLLEKGYIKTFETDLVFKVVIQ